IGAYTGREILDTLEVIAHERYEELLKKRGVLNEAFVDYRTRAALRTAADGKTVVVTETEETETTLVVAPDVTTNPPSVEDDTSNPVVTTTDERTAQVSGAALKMKRVIDRRPDAPEITIPLLRMTTVESKFSLADITDT